MKEVAHLLFMALIASALYAAYGAWFKDFATRSYDIGRRMFPSWLLWPRSLTRFTVAYKVIVIFSLVVSIGMYALFIAGFL